jgi:hypothetical protein
MSVASDHKPYRNDVTLGVLLTWCFDYGASDS